MFGFVGELIVNFVIISELFLKLLAVEHAHPIEKIQCKMTLYC